MNCRACREIALVFLLTACDGSRGAPATVPESIAVVDSAGVQIVRIDADPAMLDEWTLSATPRVLLTGAETGEFRRMGALSVAGADTVALFDRAHRRLSYWDVTTGYLGSVGLSESTSPYAWPADAWAWQDSMVVVLQLAVTPKDSLPSGVAFQKWPERAHLTLRNRTGVVVAESPFFAGMYSALYENGDARVAFSNRPFAAVARDLVYFGSGENFTLSTLSVQFDARREIRWEAMQEPVTPDEVEELRTTYAAVVGSLVSPERVDRILDREFAPELIPESRPSIGRVFVDAADRVWVERFEPVLSGPLAQKPGQLWHVLASNGRPLARLRLPARTRLEAIHGDDAVVVQRDGDDVETVAVYGIARP